MTVNTDSSSKPASVSLVIPIYNEADHLERFLQIIDSLELPLVKDLIIVDDCSKDRSREIVESFRFTSQVKFIKQPFNQGKGAALRTGIEHASGDIIGVQDADFEYDMLDIAQLLAPFVENKADIVFGSRFKRTAQVHRTFHYLINKFLTIVSNLMSGLYLSDMETCYKFFKKDIIKNIVLESNRFGFEPEVTAKIARLQVRVQELPISYYPRNYLEGKKITWKDGVAALGHIFYYNTVGSKSIFKDGMPAQYIPRGSQWL
jgi:glycosyltransferase involved in cell wall biosynthesis